MQSTMHIYEIRPSKGKRGFDLISDALPFGRAWYNQIQLAVGYAKFRSSSHPVVIHVYDAAGELIETHERKSQLKER